LTSRSPITRVSKLECESHPDDLHPDSGQALAVETKSITINTIVKEKDAIRILFDPLIIDPRSKKSKLYKLFRTRNEKISLTEYEKAKKNILALLELLSK